MSIVIVKSLEEKENKQKGQTKGFLKNRAYTLYSDIGIGCF